MGAVYNTDGTVTTHPHTQCPRTENWYQRLCLLWCHQLWNYKQGSVVPSGDQRITRPNLMDRTSFDITEHQQIQPSTDFMLTSFYLSFYLSLLWLCSTHPTVLGVSCPHPFEEIKRRSFPWFRFTRAVPRMQSISLLSARVRFALMRPRMLSLQWALPH